jgi:hypothetical protein
MIVIMTAAVFFCLAIFAAAAFADSGTVRYFYQKVCESCNPQVEFANEFFSLTGESLDGFDYLAYDTDTPAGARALQEALAPFGVGEQDIRYPVLVYGKRLYMGQEQILRNFPAYILENGGQTESFLYYVYVNGCESCMRVDEMLNDLPKVVSVKRGGIAFDSPVRVQKVNMLKEPGMAAALFDAFHVAESSRTAPLLLAGNACYRGEAEIGAFLKYSLPAGRAVNTPRLTLREQAFSLSAALAGFVGGLWGCFFILSSPLMMLIFFPAGYKKAAAGSIAMAAAAAALWIFFPVLKRGPVWESASIYVLAACAAGCLASAVLLTGAARRRVRRLLPGGESIFPCPGGFGL